MIAIFKKKVKPFVLTADIHSHILPGLDDGVDTFENSLKIIKKLLELGFNSLVLTPHVMFEGFKNSSNKILERFHKLQKKIEINNFNIKLFPAAEYYIDDGFERLIENRDLLTFADKYVLIEASYVSKPLNLESVIFKLVSLSYKPVMAHPERYTFLNTLEEFKRLKELGVYFQANINSFAGYYGKTAYNNFRIIAKNKLIDFLGTDIHRERDSELIRKIFNDRNFIDLIRNNEILNDSLF